MRVGRVPGFDGYWNDALGAGEEARDVLDGPSPRGDNFCESLPGGGFRVGDPGEIVIWLRRCRPRSLAKSTTM